MSPTATEHLALLRQHAAQLRAQADRYDQAIQLIEAGEMDVGNSNGHPKREGRQETRPTRAGRKVGKTSQLVQDYLAKHPAATTHEVAAALGAKYQTVWSARKALGK